MAGINAAFKFRLYPNTNQTRRLARMIDASRLLWNAALEHRKERWNEHRLTTSYYQQCLVLTAERRANSLLGELYSQCAQDILRRLDKAFRAFFSGKAHYPKFKKFSESGSFTYPQAYKNGSVKLLSSQRKLFLGKVGNVRIVQHRSIPSDGKLKTCTVRKETDGKWYAILIYEIQEQAKRSPSPLVSPVGIDLGLKSLITTSDGEKIAAPKFLRRTEKRLKRIQRKLSARLVGSKNREKTRHSLAVLHSKVRHQRTDFAHKLSSKLARDHDFVAFEDLEVSRMVLDHKFAKSIGDAGWSQLVDFTKYKLSRRGKVAVRVPAEYSTQECDFCGALNKMTLEIREFQCSNCHRILDRDVNAARIVLKRGLALVKVGRDTPELKPVETGQIPPGTTMVANLVGEAGTTRDRDDASHNHLSAGSPLVSFVGGCHSWMFPCFLEGLNSLLLFSEAKATTSLERVAAGGITSSIMPRLAAT